MRGLGLFPLLLILLLGGPSPAVAGARDAAALCADAIRRAEAGGGLPRGLLGAVALSESGRREPEAGRFVPWPWTVNNAGDGRYFASKGEAIAWIEELRAAGRRNIDVGCMQVNLMHHPGAFADLDEALDPAANVGYGARFLRALRDETSSWDRAVERYHNAEPDRGGAYRERVYAHWGGAGAGRLAAATAGPAVLGSGPRTASPVGQQPARHGFLRLGRGPRFLPLVYNGRRPSAGAAPLPATTARRAARPRGTPVVEAALGASDAPKPVARRPSLALLAPAPGRIAVLTGGPVAPFVKGPAPPRAGPPTPD